jgi:hypothetical protein
MQDSTSDEKNGAVGRLFDDDQAIADEEGDFELTGYSGFSSEL